MNAVDWGQLIIFLIVTAIHAGISHNKIASLEGRVKELEDGHDTLKDKHQTVELNIVNVPTKDDISALTAEVQALKMSIVKLETMLSIMAAQQNKSH